MNLNFFLSSPLEQFRVLPLITFNIGGLDCSFTNETLILVLVFFMSMVFFSSVVKQDDKSFFIITNRWQSILEIIYTLVLGLTTDNIKSKKGQLFFPLVLFLFLLVLSLNLIGLIPYSFTITSHLVVTFSLSLAIFIGINIICIRIHGMNFFSLFLPSGTALGLAFLLVPIELVSYIFKPIALATRLFANMMAGHILLKVIAGFAYTLMGSTGIFFILHYVPLLILIPLFGLELGVAIIQSFVFAILICIYLNDVIYTH
jgi:ATP synthase subunit 6